MVARTNRTGHVIKAVLFDLDGVLVHSYDAWFRLFNQALTHFGFATITEKTFRKHWGQSTAEDVALFMPGTTVDDVRDYFIAHFPEYVSHVIPDPDTLSTLRYLRRIDLILGCVTNSHRVITENIMDKHGLTPFFSAIVTADDVPRPKPAPDCILKACTCLNVQPRETVFIGDTQTDIKAGKQAGCTMVGYRISHAPDVSDLKEFQFLVSDMVKQEDYHT